MRKRNLIILFLLLPLFDYRLILGQTISKINSRIDSLESIKKDLEEQLKAINDKIADLKKYKESIATQIIEENKISAKTKHDTYLLSEPSNSSPKIIAIPAQSTVELIGYLNSFFKLIYNRKIGYIWEFYIEKNSSIETFKKSMTDQARKEEEQRNARLLEDRKRNLIKKYGSMIGEKIFERKIWLGMTKEMAIDSWGEPEDINRTVGDWGVHEQWIYGNKYLYFENGILKSWQD